jgi:hypothetical protein
MQEKNTNIPAEKKPGEDQPYPETGKQGGQGDIGKKGGQTGGDMGKDKRKTGDVGKQV